MKRRHLLGATVAGLAVSAWPEFIRTAFGEGEGCDVPGHQGAGGPAAPVKEALQRAKQLKRRLLVFIIPLSNELKNERGHAFGELLNHGGDADLAPLSDVEVVCATLADLKKVVPDAGDGEPLMVLVHTQSTPTATPLDTPLPVDPPDATTSWEERRKQEDALIVRRIAALGALLRKGLGADERKVEARAAGVRARLVKQPPAGARWASASGCGVTIEGEQNRPMMACGMGHVPEKSRRFLYFFSLQRERA
ncbi:hypothetical protein [Chondromyces crocatus]|uniref:Uncharacterized protein n=1 Tax=Chondromyces crocatus TaxID=52 RepID=A0A0K1E769_CHOCO|nr:hypothetical protein [Chondromyces crocatus]AKT36694.1 uncharacterized protein CMC5_008150 [Chondromyces crocatus]